MKKQILSFALVAAMIGSIAAGCSSVNETVGSDSPSVDSPSVVAPADTSSAKPTDTTKAPGAATNPQ
ncbi:hypothetical protein ACFQZS_04880 [Mucilaginibacter calamicampi]|uniref:Uncharacterized protein n=1 Tax=Mucilaginibacter calamicampi TaxID=1302352 RepID=A0ABW2YY47_9SPHI